MQTLTLKMPVARDALLVILASLCISLFGQIAIPLWFTPVPIVLQNTVVLLSALLLGAKRGTAATALFLAQGALGLPVFAGGAGGPFCFVGPTGGYLIGYLLASFAAGWIMERTRTIRGASLALIAGSAIILIAGASYLTTFVGVQKALSLGVAPFILGDIVKILISLPIVDKLSAHRLFANKDEKGPFHSN